MANTNDTTVYSLSTRQTKTLNVSRQPLLVYVPFTNEAPNDPVRWAAKRLPSVAAMIHSAEIDTAICYRSPKEQTGASAQFGLLLKDWDDTKQCFRVSVVAVTLRPQKVRGGVIGPQWPNGPMVTPEADAATSEEPNQS